MPRLTQEDMQLETGLADDFDAMITDAEFGINPEYEKVSGTSDPMLILTLEGPELSMPIDQAWACGAAKQWEVGRGGKEITSAKNPDSHRFNMNSRAGMLVGKMFEVVGGGDKKVGQDFFLKKDRYMTEADFYLGLNFHWKRVSMPTVGGEKRDVLMPSSFLGEAGGTKEAKGGKKSAGKAEVSDKDIETLVTLAEGKTEKELRQACVKDKDIKDNAELMNQIFNKGLLKKLVDDEKLVVGPNGKFV